MKETLLNRTPLGRTFGLLIEHLGLCRTPKEVGRSSTLLTESTLNRTGRTLISLAQDERLRSLSESTRPNARSIFGRPLLVEHYTDVRSTANQYLVEHYLDGNIVDVPNPGGRGPGYRYFGAAKKLPGVKELFEKPPELRKRRTRYDIYKRIDASYYGYRDDEDGVEVVEERQREKEEEKEKREFIVHVLLPDEKEIERRVLEKKKMELLNKYVSEGLMEEQTEAKDMLNIQR
ncbi:hypothetical protein LR48_Vigan06g058000 [Vigna angularis]|uniref:Uncharacterized protein n=1 Tax=Phaseolus angularis TaxID=3914 RepID=A0A0L9URV1_PHAAN|nr:hypothetical protein LR48_Vigan06g058000 [Vigna angularis]